MPILLRRVFTRSLFSAAFFSRLPTRTLRFRKMELSTTLPLEVGFRNNAKMREESPLTEVSEDAPTPKPKAPRKRKTSAKTAVDKDEESIEGVKEKPKRQPRKRKAAKDPIVEDEDEAEPEQKSPPKRRRKVAVTKEGDEEDGEPKKKRRRKTPEEEKVYDIPPIENVLSTTFKGRLGYACLNTILRKYSTPVFCSRTCRLSTLAELGPEHLQSLALQNVRDLLTLVKWNAQNNIFFMRVSSEMFPFASHPEHGYDLSFADKELKEVGDAAKELGMRLTSHPGQFTQLGSPREVVVRNAVRDLTYHCEMMDRMGLGKDSVMIIHMGGVFNDKSATLERFKENYIKLPENVKGRLVLENDELCYNVDDLLPVCKALNIPLVFDYHHDWIYPSTRPPKDLIPEINQLWHAKGIKPKQHVSEPRPGAVTVMEKRAHSDRIAKIPDDAPDDMDLMLECKDKEQAVLYLYRLYGLCEVDPRALRPPAEVETLHTNGRKSTKRARAKAAKEAAEVEDASVDDNNDVKEEVKREAEEHGIPARETQVAVEETLKDGGLECGSGDEELEVEDVNPIVKAKRGRKPKTVKKEEEEEEKANQEVPAKGRIKARTIGAPKRGRASMKKEAI